MGNEQLIKIVKRFQIEGTVAAVVPLGKGLINDTYWVKTCEVEKPDYVLQRINHQIFTDVELLQHNIEAVTNHLRRKLLEKEVADTDRRSAAVCVDRQRQDLLVRWKKLLAHKYLYCGHDDR